MRKASLVFVIVTSYIWKACIGIDVFVMCKEESAEWEENLDCIVYSEVKKTTRGSENLMKTTRPF